MWALVTPPPHFLPTVTLDEDVAKMSILGMVPLALQHRAEQADVWTPVLICGCVLIRSLWLLCTAACVGA